MRTVWTVAVLMAGAVASDAAVIDRVAVIVGRRAVKTSDIERELRVTSFLNRQPVERSAAARRKAADRLVDQELVRQDLLNGQYPQPTDQDVAALVAQLKRDRFGSSQTRMNAELERYQLTPEELRKALLWHLTVLRFIDLRFRAGVLVTDEEAAQYYKDHRAELEKAYPSNHTKEALLPKIRETITGERINQAFEEWLAESRKNVRIEYRPQAFTEGASQ